MKLTTELIFERLSGCFDVKYTVSHNKGTLVSRPVFCSPHNLGTDHLCVLTPKELSALSVGGGAYVCVGEPPARLPAANLELLAVTGGATVASVFNTLQEIFDHYDAWEDKLGAIIENDKSYFEIIQCSADYLGCPISLLDEDFNIVAISAGSEKDAADFRDQIDDNKLSAAIMSELITDPAFSKGLHNKDVFEFTVGGNLFLSHNFRRDGRYLGRLTLKLEKPAHKEAYAHLVRFLARRIETVLRKYGSFLRQKEAFSSLRAIISDCLESKPPERSLIEATLKENGWLYTDSYQLIRLQPEFRHEWQLHTNYLIPMIERMWPGACAVEHEDYIAVLLNQTFYAANSQKSFIQELAYFLRDNLLLAGISRPFTGLEQAAAYYRQTELAVSLGRDSDPMCWYYCFDDYALSCWLTYGTYGFTPEQICSGVLLHLIAYDRENNTEYYKTLRTFFSSKFSYTHAADALYIHRTTLIKRIERIAELTRVNLDDPDTILYIAMSFKYIDKIHPQYAAPPAGRERHPR
jgi:hypothetical protein